MRPIKFLSTLSISAVMFMGMQSCNSSDENKGDDKKDSKTVKKDTLAANPAKPNDILVVMHKVSNFDKWLTLFEGDDSVQRANGLTRSVVCRGLDDPNMILIEFRMADYQKAKAMTTSAELKARMEKGGVAGAPSFHFLNMQVNDTTTNSMTDRMIIFSKVKDYDIWKKSYDEHSEVRKNGGVKDRGIGYSYDDKNSVTVVLAINDIKKSRDFIKSPELKARMDSSGVIGKPDMFFYHVVKQY
jgi:hypothetical protein